MRYFTPSLLVAVLASLAVSAVPTRRGSDPRAGQVPQLALTTMASGATRTALPSLHSQDGGPNLTARVIVAPQGAAVSFGQPDDNEDVPIDISTPPVVQTTTIFVATSTSFSSFFTIAPVIIPTTG